MVNSESDFKENYCVIIQIIYKIKTLSEQVQKTTLYLSEFDVTMNHHDVLINLLK